MQELIADLINDADIIFCIGAGYSSEAASVISYSLYRNAYFSINSQTDNTRREGFLVPPQCKALVIALSYSGETQKIIQSVSTHQNNGSIVVSITNNINSTLTKKSDYVLYASALNNNDMEYVISSIAIMDSIISKAVKKREQR